LRDVTNVEQEDELLEYALTSPPSCGTLDMQGTNRIYLTESGIGGEQLEDASHVISKRLFKYEKI
jgi:hypothetical protein